MYHGFGNFKAQNGDRTEAFYENGYIKCGKHFSSLKNAYMNYIYSNLSIGDYYSAGIVALYALNPIQYIPWLSGKKKDGTEYNGTFGEGGVY